MSKRSLTLASFILLAGCVGRREPAPAPRPAPRPQARPAPAPAPIPAPPAPAGWADLPLTSGTWGYENAGSTSSATFGTPGAPLFRVYCEGPTRSVFLQRYGAAAARTMAVRTSFGARSFPASPDADAELGSATLPARDAFLDNMIFSRGRISVETPGLPALIMPSWAEPARVVEDCRR